MSFLAITLQFKFTFAVKCDSNLYAPPPCTPSFPLPGALADSCILCSLKKAVMTSVAKGVETLTSFPFCFLSEHWSHLNANFWP